MTPHPLRNTFIFMFVIFSLRFMRVYVAVKELSCLWCVYINLPIMYLCHFNVVYVSTGI